MYTIQMHTHTHLGLTCINQVNSGWWVDPWSWRITSTKYLCMAGCPSSHQSDFEPHYFLIHIKLVPCGTDGRLLFSGFQAVVTLTLTLYRVIRHTVVHQSSTSIYIPNLIEIGKTFCGQTYGRMDVPTEGRIFPPLMLLGRLGGVDLKMKLQGSDVTTLCRLSIASTWHISVIHNNNVTFE